MSIIRSDYGNRMTLGDLITAICTLTVMGGFMYWLFWMVLV